MYKEVNEKLNKLRKLASAEEYEVICANIAKEAGILGNIVNGALIAPSVVKGAKLADNIAKAPDIINESNITQVSQLNKMKKIAAAPEKPRENKYESSFNEKMYKAMPYAIGASAIGLSALQIAHGQNPLKSIGKGTGEGLKKMVKANPVGKMVISAAKSALDFNKKTVKETAMKLYRGDVQAKMDFKYMKDGALKTRIQEELKSLEDNKYNKYGLQNSIPYKELVQNATEDVKKAYPRESIAHKALGGFAQGATIGSGAFVVHHLGDEFFRLKDKEELRKHLRESYSNSDKGKDDKINWQSPKQQAANLMSQFNVDKNAGAIPEGGIVKDILVNDVYKNAKRSLVYMGVPAGAAALTQRDVRKDFKKLDKTNNGDKIIVDIPLAALDKKAGVDAGKIKAAVINHIKTNAVEDGRNAIKAVSWTAPPTIATVALGRNIRGNMEKLKQDDLGPVPPGKARIIIETNRGGNGSDADNYYGAMGKRGSDSEDGLTTSDYADSGDIATEKNLSKLEHIRLHHGVLKRMKMIPPQAMEATNA